MLITPGHGGTIFTTGQVLAPDGTSSAPSYSFSADRLAGINHPATNDLDFVLNGGAQVHLDTASFRLTSGLSLDWAGLNDAHLWASDLRLFRDASDTLAQRRTTNAQTFRVYGTFTDTSNYERLSLTTTQGSGVSLLAETAGTGADNLSITLTPAGTGLVSVTSGLVCAGTQGLGYTTGAGSSVNQGSGSGKATAVTINAACGKITMDSAALNTGVEVSFAVSNTSVAATDVIVVNHSSAGTAGAYLVGVSAVGSNTFTITVSNASGGSLSEAIVLSFAVIKGVTS